VTSLRGRVQGELACWHTTHRYVASLYPTEIWAALISAEHRLPSSRRCQNDARHRAPHPPPLSCPRLARTPCTHERQVGRRRAMGGRMQARCVRCRGGALQGVVTWQW